MAYITLAEFKSYHSELTGGVPASYTANEDALLTILIQQAQAEIERITNRTFEASASTTKYFTIDDISGRSLWFSADCLTVTALTNGDGTTISSGDYWLVPFNNSPKWGVLLKSAAAWAFSGDGRIEVTGTWGFATTAPDDIKRLTHRLAWFYWQKRSATGETTVLGDGGTVVAAEYPADIQKTLKRYTRRGIA
jgi:hypothetical protein